MSQATANVIKLPARKTEKAKREKRESAKLELFPIEKTDVRAVIEEACLRMAGGASSGVDIYQYALQQYKHLPKAFRQAIAEQALRYAQDRIDWLRCVVGLDGNDAQARNSR